MTRIERTRYDIIIGNERVVTSTTYVVTHACIEFTATLRAHNDKILSKLSLYLLCSAMQKTLFTENVITEEGPVDKNGRPVSHICMYMGDRWWCPIFMNCISCLFKEEKVWHFRYRSSFNWLSLHFQVQKKASDDAKAAEGLYRV